jgi:hypothetical protein
LSQFGGQLQVAKFCHFLAERKIVSTKTIDRPRYKLIKAAVHSSNGTGRAKTRGSGQLLTNFFEKFNFSGTAQGGKNKGAYRR